ncbi:MAG: nucleotidyltransferase domain-containing protein [Candidatus Latescibacterota bacterium]
MNTQTILHHEITIDNETIENFCRENGIRKLSLFGSVLRDDFTPESDIDVLVEFMPGEAVTLIRLSQMERGLSKLFGDRKINLRTPRELSDYFRDRVLAEAEELYVYR